jgi:uracil-DNA glycosylase family 4
VTEAERRAALGAIAQEVAVCTRCRLHQTRTRAVPGEGHPETEVVFVGEGPGFNEDRQGRPFVGQAGAKLDALLTSVGWRRDEVFITNVVKCRPPENRDPEPDEIAACAPFLTRQLEALDPSLVVTLGRFSMARFSPGARIGQVHGTYRPADTASGAPEALAYAMYHPAAALHQGSLNEALFRDMLGVPEALVAARMRRTAAATPLDRAAVEAPAEEVGAEPPALVEVADPAPAALQVPEADPAAEPASPLASEAETRPAAQLPLF